MAKHMKVMTFALGVALFRARLFCFRWQRVAILQYRSQKMWRHSPAAASDQDGAGLVRTISDSTKHLISSTFVFQPWHKPQVRLSLPARLPA